MARVIPFAPWAEPKVTYLDGRVYVQNVTSWHVLNSLVYCAWRKLHGPSEASS